MNELIEHNCPVEGEMMVEEGQPCNWCDELDNPSHPSVGEGETN